MAYFRTKKMESLIQREISDIIRKEIKDPRIKPLNTTVSRVEVSKDIRYVKVYISVLGDDQKVKETMEGMKSARGFIQSKIGEALSIRFTPELTFKLDDSFSKGDRVLKKINELANSRKDKSNNYNDKKNEKN